ncbi:collagen alpha-1(I) chain-like [Choloepus didactylus]|uniref:collagen alpha-1(I) chain-like n=1 Tax=Choloepus didactylus TaxID=27675 RepID=UPI00189E025C|nr:collagen alpha-1(I) chain-like [Choloepus didactylus]
MARGGRRGAERGGPQCTAARARAGQSESAPGEAPPRGRPRPEAGPTGRPWRSGPGGTAGSRWSLGWRSPQLLPQESRARRGERGDVAAGLGSPTPASSCARPAAAGSVGLGGTADPAAPRPTQQGPLAGVRGSTRGELLQAEGAGKTRRWGPRGDGRPGLRLSSQGLLELQAAPRPAGGRLPRQVTFSSSFRSQEPGCGRVPPALSWLRGSGKFTVLGSDEQNPQPAAPAPPTAQQALAWLDRELLRPPALAVMGQGAGSWGGLEYAACRCGLCCGEGSPYPVGQEAQEGPAGGWGSQAAPGELADPAGAEEGCARGRDPDSRRLAGAFHSSFSPCFEQSGREAPKPRQPPRIATREGERGHRNSGRPVPQRARAAPSLKTSSLRGRRRPRARGIRRSEAQSHAWLSPVAGRGAETGSSRTSPYPLRGDLTAFAPPPRDLASTWLAAGWAPERRVTHGTIFQELGQSGGRGPDSDPGGPLALRVSAQEWPECPTSRLENVPWLLGPNTRLSRGPASALERPPAPEPPRCLSPRAPRKWASSLAPEAAARFLDVAGPAAPFEKAAAECPGPCHRSSAGDPLQGAQWARPLGSHLPPLPERSPEGLTTVGACCGPRLPAPRPRATAVALSVDPLAGPGAEARAAPVRGLRGGNPGTPLWDGAPSLGCSGSPELLPPPHRALSSPDTPCSPPRAVTTWPRPSPLTRQQRRQRFRVLDQDRAPPRQLWDLPLAPRACLRATMDVTWAVGRAARRQTETQQGLISGPKGRRPGLGAAGCPGRNEDGGPEQLLGAQRGPSCPSGVLPIAQGWTPPPWTVRGSSPSSPGLGGDRGDRVPDVLLSTSVPQLLLTQLLQLLHKVGFAGCLGDVQARLPRTCQLWGCPGLPAPQPAVLPAEGAQSLRAPGPTGPPTPCGAGWAHAWSEIPFLGSAGMGLKPCLYERAFKSILDPRKGLFLAGVGAVGSTWGPGTRLGSVEP